MSKKEGVKEAIKRIADEEIPQIMEQVMAQKDLDIEERVSLTGLLNTAAYHLKLALTRLE